jgi:hypothetical protein
MQNSVPGRRIEILTAVMLGLVSVATAVGAWQAAVWTSDSDRYELKARDARDQSITQSVIADYDRRADREASANAAQYYALSTSADPREATFGTLQLTAALGQTTTGFPEAWKAWADSGFSPSQDAMLNPDYVISRDKASLSASYISTVAIGISDGFRYKADRMAQAALVQAVALFLLGIAGVNRNPAVRLWILALGVFVFIIGVAVATAAF